LSNLTVAGKKAEALKLLDEMVERTKAQAAGIKDRVRNNVDQVMAQVDIHCKQVEE
jgi:hypothetical protein